VKKPTSPGAGLCVYRMFGRVWRDTSEKVNFKLQYAHTVDYSTWYVDFAAYRRWRGFIGLTLSLTAEVQLATCNEHKYHHIFREGGAFKRGRKVRLALSAD
jgi:hypothetical protein